MELRRLGVTGLQTQKINGQKTFLQKHFRKSQLKSTVSQWLCSVKNGLRWNGRSIATFKISQKENVN